MSVLFETARAARPLKKAINAVNAIGIGRTARVLFMSGFLSLCDVDTGTDRTDESDDVDARLGQRHRAITSHPCRDLTSVGIDPPWIAMGHWCRAGTPSYLPTDAGARSCARSQARKEPSSGDTYPRGTPYLDQGGIWMKTSELVLIGGRQTTAKANESYCDSADRRLLTSEARHDGGMPQ